MKIKSAIFVLLLFFTLPGCLARYGEDRLGQLLSSIEKLSSEPSEVEIKRELGKPGFLKPIYERKLGFPSPCSDPVKEEERKRNLCRLHNLKRDANVSLMPNCDNLYSDMITAVKDDGLTSIKLLSYVYDRMGFEDPSLTFYIEDREGIGNGSPKVFGWDFAMIGSKYYKDHLDINMCNCDVGVENIDCDKSEGPGGYLRKTYIYLIDTVIGLKQFAGEIIKSPISFLEAELFENMIMEGKIPFYRLDGFKAAGEDWRNGITALTYRHRIYGDQGVLATTQNLLGEIPLIGSVFDQWLGKNSGNANKLFLTRGIYGGDDYSQIMDLWVHYLKNPPEGKCPPDQPGYSAPEETNRVDSIVKIIPYRYGSGVDVFWALLNISHGYAYEMASEIVSDCGVRKGNTVALSGHSGGVQRSIATARILNDDGIKVEKIYGIAGPALGYAPCNNTKVVLNRNLLQDFTSTVSRLLKYITLCSLTLNVDWDYDDRKDRYKDKKFYYHRTPGFYDGKTRLKYDGFLYDNLKYLK